MISLVDVLTCMMLAHLVDGCLFVLDFAVDVVDWGWCGAVRCLRCVGSWGDLIVVLRCAMLVLMGLLGWFDCGGSLDANVAMLW